MSRAFERRLRVGDVGREIGLRQIVGDDGAVGKNRLSERPKAALTGDIRAGPPLRFVGQVEVFKLGFAIDRGNLCRELFGRFALAADRSDDGFAARLELAPIDQSFRQEAQLRVIETAARLLAIARDEGHGRALIKQPDRRSGLFGPRADLRGDQYSDTFQVGGHLVFRLGKGGGDHSGNREPTPSNVAKPNFRSTEDHQGAGQCEHSEDAHVERSGGPGRAGLRYPMGPAQMGLVICVMFAICF